MLLPNKKDTALKTRFGTLFGAQGGPRSFLDAAGRITASQRCFLMSQNRSGNDSGTPFEARVRSQGPSQRRGVTSLRATSVPRARGKFHVCRVLAFPRQGGWRQGVQKVFLHALALSRPPSEHSFLALGVFRRFGHPRKFLTSSSVRSGRAREANSTFAASWRSPGEVDGTRACRNTFCTRSRYPVRAVAVPGRAEVRMACQSSADG